MYIYSIYNDEKTLKPYGFQIIIFNIKILNTHNKTLIFWVFFSVENISYVFSESKFIDKTEIFKSVFIETKGQVHILEIKNILIFSLTFSTADLVCAIGKYFDVKKWLKYSVKVWAPKEACFLIEFNQNA